ncbi:MAG: WD40/YVTN/BNR-like repeat-containing protein, partial [Acidothermaceae bacterium]
MKTVDYAGVQITIPDTWAVVNFDTDATACRSFDGPTLYLGSTAGVPNCAGSSSPSADGTIELTTLSDTIWSSTRPSDPAIVVNGQTGLPVKGPGVVAFPGLNLLAILDHPQSRTQQAVLHSIRQVGVIASPTPSATPTIVDAMGLVGPGAGWALTGDGVWRTADDGARWRSITPRGANVAAISAAFFVDVDHGWVTVGIPPHQTPNIAPVEVIYRTNDGGASWRSTRLTLKGQQYYDTGYVESNDAAISFIDPLHGWLEMPRAFNTSHSAAVLYRTVDGGASWTQVQAPVAGPLVFTSPTHGWTSGGVGDNIALYATDDGGVS